MSRLPRRPVVLAATLVLAVIALLRYGIPVTILVLALGLTAAVLVGRHQAGKFTVRKKGPRGPIWKPMVLARSRGIEVRPEGQPRLMQALALSAVQGVLLAEWRQLEDGATVWDGTTARIRASDAFSIQHITDEMERRQLPELFAGIARRPPDFEVRLLLPYALASAFYMRLHGKPPHAFAA